MGKPSGEAGLAAIVAPTPRPADTTAGSVPLGTFFAEGLRGLGIEPLRDDIARVQRLLSKKLTGTDRFFDTMTSHLAAAAAEHLPPVLVLCGAYAAQHGLALEPVPEDAVTAAVAVEALHLCTLYHDVTDHMARSRGTGARWDNRIAVIGGDMLLARAFELGASIGSAHVAQFAYALEELCAGRASELSSLYDPHRDEAAYECAIVGKSASLMVASLNAGGLASALAPGDMVLLSAAGRELGIAFQLVDDLLDILSSAGFTGKPAYGGDIESGVYTLPVILELRTNARLRDLLSSPPSTSEAEEARQLVLAGDGPATTAGRARDHVEHALSVLGESDVHPAVKRTVERLGNLILEPVRSLQPRVLAAR